MSGSRKRKSDGELQKFVWKRNIKYDITLLAEVEGKNPFSFKNAKPVWEGIATVLQEGALKMKVTHRSCRDRVNDLLKIHRGEERRSKIASGVEEPDMTELQHLLTSVDKLQKGGQDAQVRDVYADDRSEAEAIRAEALLAVQNDGSNDSDHHITTNSNDNFDILDVDDLIVASTSDVNGVIEVVPSVVQRVVPPIVQRVVPPIVPSVIQSDDVIEISTSSSTASVNNPKAKARPASKRNRISTSSSTGKANSTREPETNWQGLQSFFTDGDEGDGDENRSADRSEQLLQHSTSHSHKGNPKKDLVRYLEGKSEKEYEVRKEELTIRKDEVKLREKEINVKEKQAENEVKLREKEINVKEKEAENKSKELDILLERAKGDVENQKRLTDLLVTLVGNR